MRISDDVIIHEMDDGKIKCRVIRHFPLFKSLINENGGLRSKTSSRSLICDLREGKKIRKKRAASIRKPRSEWKSKNKVKNAIIRVYFMMDQKERLYFHDRLHHQTPERA